MLWNFNVVNKPGNTSKSKVFKNADISDAVICIAMFQNLVKHIFHAKIRIIVNRPLTLSLRHRSVHSICSLVCLCLRFGSVSKSHREECEAKWRMPSSSSKVNQSANPPVETSRLNKVCKCVCLQVQWSWADPLPWAGLSWWGSELMPGVMGRPPAERQGSAIRSMGQKLRRWSRAQDRERKMCVCVFGWWHELCATRVSSVGH